MHFASKTLAAIDAAILRDKEQEFRNHLGASLIGDECARRVWYQWRWTLAEEFEPRMLRLFGDGHHLEPRVLAWLRAAGIELWVAGEFGTDKALMRVTAHDGHFGGTPDFIGRKIPDLDPTVAALVEVKSHNEKSFNKLVADGIMSTKWKHFVQMQVYMGYHKLPWALYIAYCKNDSRIQPELVQFDQKAYDRALDRAGAIIWNADPPTRIGKNPAHFGCKFCHLKRLCYFGDIQPARNCRTCQWSAPIPGGQWTCKLHSQNLDEAAQRAACPSYQVNPKLHEKT